MWRWQAAAVGSEHSECKADCRASPAPKGTITPSQRTYLQYDKPTAGYPASSRDALVMCKHSAASVACTTVLFGFEAWQQQGPNSSGPERVAATGSAPRSCTSSYGVRRK